jgi:hypothetical protein
MSEAERQQRQREPQGSPPEAPEPQRRILRDYIAEPAAAIELGIDKRTLRKWRRTGEGPPGYVRIGHRFFYRAEVIEAWLRSREAKPIRQRAERKRKPPPSPTKRRRPPRK